MVALEIPLVGDDAAASFGAGQLLFSLKEGGAVDDDDEAAAIEAAVIGLLFCDFFLLLNFDDCPMVGEADEGCIASGAGVAGARAESDDTEA